MSDDWNSMTVAQLKSECTNRGLQVSGKKSDLVARLEEHTKGATEADLLAPTAGEDVTDEPIDDKILNEDEAPNGDSTEVKEEQGGEATASEEAAEAEEKPKEEEKKMEVKKEEEKKDTKKISLPEGVPDLPTYAQIQEARIAETRMRTVIVYPMNIEDMSNVELQTELSKSQHFMVKFVQDVEKRKKGFVEMHFNTRKDAREAAGVLRDIKLSVGEHTVRQLEPDEAGTAYKSAVIDTIRPHLTHQIKKATDDYDTRVVYVHNLPDDCSDEQLAEIFPEAKAILTAIDNEEKNKGYAYLSFETEEESEDCIKKHTDLKIDDNRVTLHMIRDLKIAAGIEARKPFRRLGRGRQMKGGKKDGPKGKMQGGARGGRGPRGGPPRSPRDNRNSGNRREGGRWMGGPGNNMRRGGMGGGMRSPRGGQVPPLMGGPMPRPLMGGQGGRGGYQNQGRNNQNRMRRGGGGGGKNLLNSGMNYIDFGGQGRKRKADGGYGQQQWKMPRQMGNQGGYGGGGWNRW